MQQLIPTILGIGVFQGKPYFKLHVKKGSDEVWMESGENSSIITMLVLNLRELDHQNTDPESYRAFIKEYNKYQGLQLEPIQARTLDAHKLCLCFRLGKDELPIDAIPKLDKLVSAVQYLRDVINR